MKEKVAILGASRKAERILQDAGIQTEEACTLVLLRTNQYEK